jgi:tetratricopeptide (TPR) repeat protein
MSNYFPRFSPDGKWIVFTKASNFMLLQPDSELYIMPAEGGTPRRMTCNTSNMNSWHSWSPNGKWLVFASKERGPYTQLFLTHIDEDGNDTPAVLLEHVTLAGRAANIPEFVNIRPDEMEEITAEFLDDKHFYRQGALADNFDYEASVKYYKRALEVNPSNLKARLNLGVAYREMGEDDLAEREWLKVIEGRLPGPMAHNNLAILYLNRRQFDKAREMCEGAIEAWPDSAGAYLHLGMVNAVTGNLAGAEVRFREGIRLDPGNAKAHAILGSTLEQRGRPREALRHYRTALRHMPAEVDDGLDVVNLLAHRPELAESLAPIVPKLLRDYERLDGTIHPKSAAAYILLGRLHLRHGKVDSAITAFETAHKMQPASEWLKAKIDELKGRRKTGGGKGAKSAI